MDQILQAQLRLRKSDGQLLFLKYQPRNALQLMQLRCNSDNSMLVYGSFSKEICHWLIKGRYPCLAFFSLNFLFQDQFRLPAGLLWASVLFSLCRPIQSGADFFKLLQAFVTLQRELMKGSNKSWTFPFLWPSQTPSSALATPDMSPG